MDNLVFPTHKNNPYHAEAIRSADARINIFDGPIRSGKTIDSMFWFVLKAFQSPNENGLYLIFGKTLDSIERNILIPLSQWLPNDNFYYAKAARYAILQDQLNDIKIKIFLVGAKDVSSAAVIKGSTIFLALGDELTEIPENFFIMLDRGLSLKQSKLLGATNPDSPRHYLKVNYIDRVAELNKRFYEGIDEIKAISYKKFNIYQNPFLDPETIRKLENNFVGLWKKRYIYGEWVAASGAIYGDSFDVDKHVTDTYPLLEKCVEYYIGIDYGIKNPCVFLLVGKGIDGTFYVFNEYYWDSSKPECPTQKGVNQYLLDLKAFINDNLPDRKKLKAIYVDPSALDFIQLINKDRDIQARAVVTTESVVNKAKNAVLSGIQLVIERFLTNKLFIDRKAINTINELISYEWNDKIKTDDEPKKINDHACDTLRYIVTSTHVKNLGSKKFMLNPRKIGRY